MCRSLDKRILKECLRVYQGGPKNEEDADGDNMN